VKFTKAHAYGNDFLYVEDRDVQGCGLSALAREMCDRHTGVGADGLIVYSHAPAGARMQLHNADGSHAEVSGNGVRGLAALLLREDGRDDASIEIETVAGIKRVIRVDRSSPGHPSFRTAMGLPDGLRKTTLVVNDEAVDVVVMNMGNPQCVLLGPQPSEEQFHRLGASIERHEHFPHATNVEFATIESPTSVRMLIWERGVGPTSSSGTGSCAALVAAAAFGGARRDAMVIAPGGAQRVEWRDDSVYLTGWAEVVCEGEWFRELPR
jgi:diaminopimelate epimerase